MLRLLFLKWKKIYKLSVNPTELDFGKTKAGYGEAPEAQKVTVTNEGNTNVTLNTPSAKNFKIGKFSATELAPGESTTFKIRPKEGLKLVLIQKLSPLILIRTSVQR